MEVYASERRISCRHTFKTALRVRLWKSGPSEQKTESENLSDRGAFFTTNEPLAIGSPIEVLFRMPQEITGKPTAEWRCTGHVVRLKAVDSPGGKTGVGVQFDCYEILHSKTGLQTGDAFIRRCYAKARLDRGR